MSSIPRAWGGPEIITAVLSCGKLLVTAGGGCCDTAYGTESDTGRRM